MDLKKYKNELRNNNLTETLKSLSDMELSMLEGTIYRTDIEGDNEKILSAILTETEYRENDLHNFRLNIREEQKKLLYQLANYGLTDYLKRYKDRELRAILDAYSSDDIEGDILSIFMVINDELQYRFEDIMKKQKKELEKTYSKIKG